MWSVRERSWWNWEEEEEEEEEGEEEEEEVEEEEEGAKLKNRKKRSIWRFYIVSLASNKRCWKSVFLKSFLNKYR